MLHIIIIFSKSLSLYHTSYINYSYTTVCCVIYVTFIYHSTITPSFSNTAEKDTKHIACFQQDSEIWCWTPGCLLSVHPGVCPPDIRMLKAGLPGCSRAFAGTFMKKRALLWLICLLICKFPMQPSGMHLYHRARSCRVSPFSDRHLPAEPTLISSRKKRMGSTDPRSWNEREIRVGSAGRCRS